MGTLAFRQLPLAVKIGLWFVFNNAWWSIEEFVVDRHPWLWKNMPYYKVADACVWDLTVAIVTAVLIWRTSVRGSTGNVDKLREELL
jgi:hypothetical protein